MNRIGLHEQENVSEFVLQPVISGEGSIRRILCTKSASTQTSCTVRGDVESNALEQRLHDSEYLSELISVLTTAGQLKDFVTLLDVLKEGSLLTSNLAWKCALDRARWQRCTSTTNMRYDKQMTEFWNVMYLLFGNSALCVMRGSVHSFQVIMNETSRSRYSPDEGQCNFAVPSLSTIRRYDTGYSKRIEPGPIKASLDLVQKQADSGSQFTLSFDGKKCACGLKNETDGDVQLLGIEKPNVKDQLKQFQQHLAQAEAMLEEKDIKNASQHALKIQKQICKVSKIVQKLHKRIEGQALLRKKLKKLAMRNSDCADRFRYAISFINATTHECQNLAERSLALNERLVRTLAKCKGLDTCVPPGKHVKLGSHPQVFRLRESDDIMQHLDLQRETYYIKQGSDLWHQQRKLARVTGSSMNRALGLDNKKPLKLQQEHHYVKVQGKHAEPPDDTVKEMMEYGRVNEVNALATVVGMMMNVFCPPCHYMVEMGPVFIDSPKRSKLIEVSADGQIYCINEAGGQCPWQNLHCSDTHIMLELKCCYPREGMPHLPWYEVPARYVPQLLSEMAANKATELWLVCWTPKCSTLFFVYFSEDLWHKMFQFCDDLYGMDQPPFPRKLQSTSKELKILVREFIKTHARFVCVLPSCTGEEGRLMPPSDGASPYACSPSLELITPDFMEVLEETKVCYTELKQIYQDSFNALRVPANEVLLWTLNCKDRIHQDGIPTSFPAFYALKGTSLNNEQLQSMRDIVRDELKRRRIPILTEVYDGEWSKTVMCGIDGEPLTKLQVAKKTWNPIKGMKKERIIEEMLKTNRIGVADCDMLLVSNNLSEGTHVLTNVVIEKQTSPTKYFLSTRGGPNFPESVSHRFKYVQLTEEEETIYSRSSQPQNTRRVGLREADKNLLGTLYPDLLPVVDLNREFVQNGDNGEVIDELDEDELPDLDTLSADEEDPDFETDNDEDPDVSSQNVQGEAVGSRRMTALTRVLCHENFNLLSDLLEVLQENHPKNFSDKTQDTLLFDVLQNASELNRLSNVKDLQLICKVLKRYTGVQWYNYNDGKACNVNIIAKAFESPTTIDETIRKVRRRNPLTLLQLSKRVICSPQYHAVSLRASYANVVHHFNKAAWLKSATAPMDLEVPFQEGEVMHLYSYPEFNKKRRQLEPRMLDAVHILTKMRQHVCRKGYDFARKEAWQTVANTRPDVLSRSVVYDHIDAQNAFTAMRLFGYHVQQVMRENGFHEEAEFSALVDWWFRSANERGICADERVVAMYRIHKYLMDRCNLDKFPPAGGGYQYICGIPSTTFDALLQSCSTRIQLYNLAVDKKYNVRSCTTLPCESAFSDIVRFDHQDPMYPKACNIGKLIHKLALLNYFKHDPTKIFDLCTSNCSAYPVYLSMEDRERLNEEDESNFDGTFRDHFFDLMDEHMSNRNRRSDISTGIQPQRSAAGVRQHFRSDESRILPETRAGLPVRGLQD